MHSLQQQLQQLKSDLDNQNASALQQAASLEDCTADNRQLQQRCCTLEKDNDSLHARSSELQADRVSMQKQQQAIAWRLAELHHWKHHGCRLLRQILHAWTVVAPRGGRHTPSMPILRRPDLNSSSCTCFDTKSLVVPKRAGHSCA